MFWGEIYKKTMDKFFDTKITQRPTDGYLDAKSISFKCDKDFGMYRRTRRGREYIQAVTKFLRKKQSEVTTVCHECIAHFFI